MNNVTKKQEIDIVTDLKAINKMNSILIPFLHGIGYTILWFIGMFSIPLIIMLIHGYFTDFFDKETAMIIFWTTFILYWILSAILLILI